MSMEPWYGDHDNWMEQLREFLTSHGHDPDEFDDQDLAFVSNLAARIRRGDVTLHEAIHEVQRYLHRQLGYHVTYDEVTFRSEIDFSDLVEITEAVKDNLLVVDQPGISDALREVYADPDLTVDMDGNLVPAEDADFEAKEHRAGIAMQTKQWFDINRLNSAEYKDFNWAVATALKQHADTN